MKEIKFRVWCEFKVQGKTESCMESAASWFLLTQTGQLMEYGPMRSPHRLSGAYKKSIPLLFIGILDKNGKEIYEGDIVRRSSHILEIRFENCAFMAVCHDKEPGERWAIPGSDMEVIGNVYENPELLKEVK